MTSHITPHITPHVWTGTFPEDSGADNSRTSYGCSTRNEIWCSIWLVVSGHDVEFFSDAGFDLDRLDIRRNAPVAQLYEDAVANEGAVIGADGALIVSLLPASSG